MKILMLKGLPASGKSSWSKEFIKNQKAEWKRINKDDIRSMLSLPFTQEREKFVLKIRNSLIRESISNGFSAIIDDCNLASKHEDTLKQLAQELKCDFEVNDSFLEVPVQECIERDAKRTNSVGRTVILNMYKQFLQPVPLCQDASLPKCVIFDCDGTLNNVTNRSPYDGTTCDQDTAIEHTVDYIKYLKSKERVIIIFSGLEEKYREQREKWLLLQGITYDTLVLRTTGDNRNDAIIKEEFFNSYIKDKYYVEVIVDDRKRVGRMWTRIGLANKLLMVGDPDLEF